MKNKESQTSSLSEAIVDNRLEVVKSKFGDGGFGSLRFVCLSSKQN